MSPIPFTTVMWKFDSFWCCVPLLLLLTVLCIQNINCLSVLLVNLRQGGYVFVLICWLLRLCVSLAVRLTVFLPISVSGLLRNLCTNFRRSFLEGRPCSRQQSVRFRGRYIPEILILNVFVICERLGNITDYSKDFNYASALWYRQL